VRPASVAPTTRCDECGARLREGAEFCGKCGARVADQSRQPLLERRRNPSRAWAIRFLGLLVLLGVAAAVFAYVDTRNRANAERTSRLHDVAALRAEIALLHAQNATLAKRLKAVQRGVSQSQLGLAPLAKRVLRSVFTLETFTGTGSGFAAWTKGGYTFVLTANHVVEGASTVTVERKGTAWDGVVTRTDPVNDLGLVRVRGNVAPALWQTPNLGLSPVVGDQLLLVGSPYGLEGTVTTGVVSRITYNSIQTDAAANPGNSGGPALDRQGNVVGILLAGGGENLNFAVPIQRACVRIRSC
jgi:S1-C subfamily serine protease